jgi:hypothetical protein
LGNPHQIGYRMDGSRWMKTTLLLMIGWLLALTACQTYPNGETSIPQPTPTETFRKSIPFNTITQEAPLGDQPAQPYYGVIEQLSDLDNLVDKLPPQALEAARQAYQPGGLIFVAFAGVKGSNGYQITIQSIWEEENQIIIQVVLTKPGALQVVEPAKTLPFYLASLTSTDLPQNPPFEFVFKDDLGQILNP